MSRASSRPPSQPASSRSQRAPDAVDRVPSAAAAHPEDALSEREAASAAEDDEQGDEEEEESDRLPRSWIRKGLSDVQRTADKANYAFTRLELVGRGVKSLEGDLAAYPEVRYLNVSSNDVSDLSPLSVLPNLLSLQCTHNRLFSLDSFFATPHPQLQLLQADHNDLEHVISKAGVGAGAGKPAPKGRAPLALVENLPALFALTLSNNKIAALMRAEEKETDYAKEGHQTLQVLDLGFNQLSSLSGFSFFPSLRILNLQSNSLSSLAGIDALTQLQKLNVTHNALRDFPGEMGRLARLKQLSNLLITAGNPGLVEGLMAAAAAAGAGGEAEDEEDEPSQAAAAGGADASGLIDLTSEILILLPALSFLDGHRLTSAQRAQSQSLHRARLAAAVRREAAEAQAKRLAAEEAEAERKQRMEENGGVDPEEAGAAGDEEKDGQEEDQEENQDGEEDGEEGEGDDHDQGEEDGEDGGDFGDEDGGAGEDEEQ